MKKLGKLLAGISAASILGTILYVPNVQAASATQKSIVHRSDTMVGTAVVDITPSSPVYLGGYGYGPVRLSTGVLTPLKVHVMAIRSHKTTLLIGSIDSQGYFAAYQAGPYGLDDVRKVIASKTEIPSANILFSSLHSHAAPDTVGIWGGVPDWYLQEVHDACVQAALKAVESLQPAQLYAGQVETHGLSTSFTADDSQWPRDRNLRVLVAKKPNGTVLATMVNYGVHPTVLPSTNSKITPDWPAITEQTLSKDTNGAFSMVLIGDLGRTWPAFPSNVQPPANPYDQLTLYGNLVAAQAEKALRIAKPLPSSNFGAVQLPISEPATTGALMALYQSGIVMRSQASDYLSDGNVIHSSVTEFRLGPDVLYGMPVEPYPDLVFELEKQVPAPVTFVAGLANDQLGYAAPASDYQGIVANSPTDEALFVINPSFGDKIVSELVQAAQSLRFHVSN